MNDRTYINAAAKIEKFMEGALDEEISSQIKRRAIVGGLAMAIPLYGIEIIIYAICLWGEYGKISEISGVPFKKHAVRNIIGGFIINLIVTFVLNLIMDLIPGLIISSIGGFIVGYASLEISGMGYVKMLKRLHGNKAKADLNISAGIANLGDKNVAEEKAIETKEINFNDGSKYIGTLDANGYLSGKGKYFWPDGERYEGEYKNGVRCGYGIDYYSSGQRYEGEWKDDKRIGKGKYFWPDGDKYEGDWDGVRCGFGIHYYPDGRRYEGEWKDDIWEGHGVLYWPNGDRYDGEVSQGNLNGYGTYYSANGTSGRCEYRDGNFVRWIE